MQSQPKKIHEATIEDFQANRNAIVNAIKDSMIKIESLKTRIRNLEIEDAYNNGIIELLIAQKENQKVPEPTKSKQENPIISNTVIEPEKKSDVTD